MCLLVDGVISGFCCISSCCNHFIIFLPYRVAQARSGWSCYYPWNSSDDGGRCGRLHRNTTWSPSTQNHLCPASQWPMQKKVLQELVRLSANDFPAFGDVWYCLIAQISVMILNPVCATIVPRSRSLFQKILTLQLETQEWHHSVAKTLLHIIKGL